jgi:23S rRNA (guanine745-N1)-methyltransferase
VCGAGHSFDIARHGYVNLLQPQDRRSSSAGDSRATVASRAELIAAGLGGALGDAVMGVAATLNLAAGSVVVELGPGTGDVLAGIARTHFSEGIGIDISVPAAEHAARRFPHVTWVVANADRRLPLADASVDLVLSLHARRNSAECARVLKPDARLLVAVPAADDLIELRAAVQGDALHRPRFESLVEEHAPHFVLAQHLTAREQRTLDPAALRALLDTTYRGGRRRVHERLQTLTSLDVTLASEVLVLSRSRPASRPRERQAPASSSH